MQFEDALAVILKWEGSEYTETSGDRGGATKWGITLATLTRWRGARPTTKDDVKNLTREGAAVIYRQWYWDRVSCEKMPDGVDLLLFDSAVNEGPGMAVKHLQRACGAKMDGILGPDTQGLVDLADRQALVREMAVQRALHYAQLQPEFRHGWFRRLFDVFEIATDI